uniref:Alba domain-containing protein n=1 Tax=Parastrongyloides trichosuri TaxID=131310 RepID=A0A0N4Z2G5_PARTI
MNSLEEKEEWTFPGIKYDKNIKIVDVKENSKSINILEFMKSTFNEEITRKIIIKGSGRACHKAVSFSELFKRDYEKTIYQINKVTSAVENLNNIGSRNDCKRKTIATLWILLSKDELELSPKTKVIKSKKGKDDFDEWIKLTSGAKDCMEDDKPKKKLKRPIERENSDQVNPWARKKRMKPNEKNKKK